MAQNFMKLQNGINVGKLSTDPSSADNGDIYYNTTSNTFRKYENGIWSDLGGGSGSAEWGSITGTLSDQTDLQTALDSKVDNEALPNYIPNGYALKGTDGIYPYGMMLVTLTGGGGYVTLPDPTLLLENNLRVYYRAETPSNPLTSDTLYYATFPTAGECQLGSTPDTTINFVNGVGNQYLGAQKPVFTNQLTISGFSVSTTNVDPISGTESFLISKAAASAYGEGIKIPFMIDNNAKGKVCNIKFSYKITNGTFQGGTSNLNPSELIVWIKDVTTGELIQPSTIYLENITSFVGEFNSTFQTDINNTSYELILHQTTTSANSYEITIDNVEVNLSNYVYGSPITNWQSYIPTTQGLGTLASSSVFWRRVGGTVEIRGRITVGTPTSVEARIGFPAGLTSSSSLVSSLELAGDLTWNNSSSTYFRNSILVEPSVTYFTVGTQSSTSSAINKVNGTFVSDGGTFSFKGEAPIQGWASSVQMSDRADTRVIIAKYESTATTALSSSAYTKIPSWGVKLFDTHSSMSGDTYIVPVQGFYEISGMVTCNSYAWTTGILRYAVYKNNAFLSLIAKWSPTNSVSGAAASSASCEGSTIVELNAGDQLTFYVNQTQTASGLTLGGVETYIQIQKVSGPSTIAANEIIACSYTSTVGSTIGTSNSLQSFPTKMFDTHSSWNGTVFTAPIHGFYDINCTLVSGAINLTTSNAITMYLYKNGVQDRILDSRHGVNVNKSHTICGSTMIELNAGDTVSIYAIASVAGAQNTGAGLNYINIAKRN